MRFYDDARSSCAWRVRWALFYKQLDFVRVPVLLALNQQKTSEHLQRSPLGRIPVLEVSDGENPVYLSESVAIIEWLEETYPDFALLPKNPSARAIVRELVQYINAWVQPLQSLTVIKKFSDDEAMRQAWAKHWIYDGFAGFEKRIAQTAGRYCFGDDITMADLCLVPQVFNAETRFGMDLSEFSQIKSVTKAALLTKACQSSHPSFFAV